MRRAGWGVGTRFLVVVRSDGCSRRSAIPNQSGCGRLTCHHVKHWLHGGPASPDNLVLLCGFHHRLLHEAGFTVKLSPDGEVEVRTRAGAVLPEHPTVVAERTIVDWGYGTGPWPSAPQEPKTDHMTTMPEWDGERMDLDWVVAAIA